MLLTESFMEFPDPEAAANTLIALSKIIGIDIDVGELLQQAEIIRIRAMDLMKSTSHAMARMGKELEYSVPLHM